MIISLIGNYIDKSEYTRAELSKRFKVHRNTISNWCTGKSYPSVPQLFELASLLNVKVDDLYIYKEDKDE
jgi:putative transcriptional regulator